MEIFAVLLFSIFNQVDPGEPFPKPILDDADTLGALFYLKRLLVWLDQLGMKANIDLHGAPGSQNGFEKITKIRRCRGVNTYPTFFLHR